MIYLLLSIVCTSSLLWIFKWIRLLGIDTLTAITINYATCAVIGYFMIGTGLPLSIIPQQDWFLFCLLFGGCFILVFFAMARCSQQQGASISALSSRMGLIIPVLFSIWFLGETPGESLLPGLIISLSGVFLAFYNPGMIKKAIWVLPVFVLIGSGFIDSGLAFIKHQWFNTGNPSASILVLFSGAFLPGFLIVAFQMMNKKKVFQWKAVLAGIVLGTFNYFSIHALILGLQSNILPTNVFYPVNHVSIVILTIAGSMLFFRERLKLVNWAGVALCCAGIALLSKG